MTTHARTPRHGGRAIEEAPAGECLAVPRLVQWMATARCPLACPHCLAAAEGGPGAEMSLAEAGRLIEQVAAMGVEEFLLTGGEPLARADLPEVVGLLRSNRVRWSLNTAAMPDRAVRRAMATWPPSFVAVSLDGPKAVHDAFRGRAGAFEEALDSLAYFSGLVPSGVAAGTTVTRVNFPHLAATFGVVIESGASQWGLHLPVPEGRAAARPDLFLRRRELKELLAFAATKRQHFPVVMADEIGYCGAWEPLLRDGPFFCGAGKAQCVVLPDGEVVPCTTLDRSTSAGNVLTRPLAEIWRDGFAELRAWRPAGKCAACRYAPACEGGCWLQRRRSTQCFRDVWRMPRPLAKAGLAVCLGLAAAGVAAPAMAGGKDPPAEVSAEAEAEAQKMEVLQRSIIQWYAAEAGGRRAPTTAGVVETLKKDLPDDPGAKYVLGFIDGKRPETIAARAKEIGSALETKQRSLCLVGLGWRDLTEWCLDGAPAAGRTAEERKALREVLGRLATTAEAWRQEIFRDKLDPFLRRTSAYRRFFMSKAGPPADVSLARGVAQKRGWTNEGLTEAYLEDHPYGDVMTLPFEAAEGASLRVVRAGKEGEADGTLRVFDILLAPARDGAKPTRLSFNVARMKIEVDLPAGAELTYADVLRLGWEQNREMLSKWAEPAAPGLRPPAAALVLPALRERLKESPAPEAGKAPDRGLAWKLADLYLF